MMLVLENSSPICSLALADADCQVIAKTDVKTEARYSETLLPSLNEWLVQQKMPLSRLDTVVYGRGPGSFTGIRIAAAMMQAITLTQNIKLGTVSSLAVLAASAPAASKVLTVLEAGLGEIYFAAFNRTACGLENLYAEAALKPETAAGWLATQNEHWLILGNGGEALAKGWPQAKDYENDYERVPKAWHIPSLFKAQQHSEQGEIDATGTPNTDSPLYLQADRPWRRD